MTSETLPDVKAQKNRLHLKPEINDRLDRWVETINSSLKGVTVKRSDLVNWLIGSRPEDLGSRDLISITKEFFDEGSFAIWALQTVKEALARGEVTTLADVMKMRPEGAPVASERPSKAKTSAPKTSRSHMDNAPHTGENSTPIFSK